MILLRHVDELQGELLPFPLASGPLYGLAHSVAVINFPWPASVLTAILTSPSGTFSILYRPSSPTSPVAEAFSP